MSGYKGVCICYMAYLCSARWLFFGYFPDELPRTLLRRSSNREGHSPGPFDRAPPNRSAYLLSVKLGIGGLPEAS
jgi:hypothetical protein